MRDGDPLTRTIIAAARGDVRARVWLASRLTSTENMTHVVRLLLLTPKRKRDLRARLERYLEVLAKIDPQGAERVLLELHEAAEMT